MITALITATALFLAPAPLDTVPNQNEYLSIAHKWFPGASNDQLSQLAMQTCVSMHPYGPNVHVTAQRENLETSILMARYHMDQETATAYVGLVEVNLCP